MEKIIIIFVLFNMTSVFGQKNVQIDSSDISYSIKFMVLQGSFKTINKDMINVIDSIINKTSCLEIKKLKSKGFNNVDFYKLTYTVSKYIHKYEYIVGYNSDGNTYYRLKGFLNNDFSIGITGLAFNKSSKTDNFLTDDTRTMIEYQVIPYVRYAMSKSATNLYYLEAFTNFNGGQYKELTTLNNGTADYIVVTKSDYNDVALGASMGYKLYFKEGFVADFTVGIGKNLFNTESPSTIARLGINLGYRF